MEKIEIFAQRVEDEQIERLKRLNLGCEANIINARTHIKKGRKYTKVNVGSSGKFMIENTTGEIYGIKAYGQVHKGHRYGTLDTIDEYYWGEYSPERK